MSSVVFTGTQPDSNALYNQIRTHLTTTALAASETAGVGNIGNGGVTNLFFKTMSTPQTFTLTCTAAAANAGTFIVSGSTTGAMGNATVGVVFDHAQIGFTIADGAIDFAIGDTFNLVSVAWTENKIENLADTGALTGRRASYLQAPGLSNADNIYMIMTKFDNVGADTYNWGFNGATNFDTNQSFDNQPGGSPAVFFPLWNNTMQYWLIANGRRFILIVKVSGIFFCCYNGFILPYGTSSEYPYPLFISGACESSANRYSLGSYSLSNFWHPTNISAQYRDIDGSWKRVRNISSTSSGSRFGVNATESAITPYDAVIAIGNNIDGSFGLIQPQLILRTESNNERLEGVFEGLQYVSGFGNASEDIQQIAGYPNDFIVVQNTYRTDIDEFAAIELG